MRSGTLVVVLACLLAGAHAAWAAPSGGTVASGTATIQQAGITPTITQGTNQAIINWQSFSIAPNERVQSRKTDIFLSATNTITFANSTAGRPGIGIEFLQDHGRGHHRRRDFTNRAATHYNGDTIKEGPGVDNARLHVWRGV